MKIEDHKKILNQIKAISSDNADLSNLVMELEQDYIKVDNDLNSANIEKETLKTERDKFALLNNQLWLQTNTKADVAETTETTETTETIPHKRNFEDLEKHF